MKTHATYDDVHLVIRLYKLRREEKLQEAHSWFERAFKARTVEEFNSLCPPGSEENSHFRVVMNYWEMVASFITCEVLNPELFFQSGRELLFVWEKIRDLVPLYRESFKDPTLFKNLETAVNSFIQWLNAQSSEAYLAFAASVRGLSG